MHTKEAQPHLKRKTHNSHLKTETKTRFFLSQAYHFNESVHRIKAQEPPPQ
jgi:hypothetical protein